MREGPSYAFDPPSGARARHYLVAMLAVGCALAGAGRALDRTVSVDAPSETQDTVLVDLPPVETGAHPQGDDAPTQQAAPAASAATPRAKPEEVEPPKPAAIEIPKSPPPQPAPATAPQDAHEAGGPRATPAPDADADAAETETHRAAAHQITLWQKALMARLQAARHALPHHAPLAGLAKIAFEIDRDGHLVSARIAENSGSAAVDAAALALVRLAAPYPAPPHDAGAAQLAFVVPISFRR